MVKILLTYLAIEHDFIKNTSSFVELKKCTPYLIFINIVIHIYVIKLDFLL